MEVEVEENLEVSLPKLQSDATSNGGRRIQNAKVKPEAGGNCWFDERLARFAERFVVEVDSLKSRDLNESTWRYLRGVVWAVA